MGFYISDYYYVTFRVPPIGFIGLWAELLTFGQLDTFCMYADRYLESDD